jgi:tetratricopeptide (TPR) repeat protein
VPARLRSGASVAWSIALFGAMVLVAPAARADRITDAEDLFRRAKALIAQDKYDDACPLLAESYRLDPGMGTLLNLALCHEHVGKTASAWGEFRAVEQQARAAVPPNEGRAQLAREHADKLQPRLSRVKIVVANEARAPGLVIKVDGEAKGEPLWAGVPVDPGTRTVEASATDKKPVVMKVKIDDEGVLAAVTIPVLADAPVAAPTSGGGAELEAVEAYASNRARRTTGFVIGGIGLATLAVGATFGIAAILDDNEAKTCSPCIRGSAEANASDHATDRALVFANIANVTVPLGVIGSVVGAYLVLGTRPGRSVSVVPVTSPTSAGVAMSGLW